MEEFNYHLNEANESDVIGQLSFINRGDFSSADVDRVLFETQDSLLGSIDSGPECQDSSGFLNPISDILGDINEFKNFYCDQVSTMSVHPPTVQEQSTGQSNCSWSPSETTDGTQHTYITEQTKNAAETSNSIGNEIFNVGTENGSPGLLSDSPLVEFPTSDCTTFEEYSSAINQWFHGIEQQQMFMSTPYSTHPLSAHNRPYPSYGYSDAFLNTIGSLPASTTVTPIAIDEHQMVQPPMTPRHQNVSVDSRFLSEENIDGNKDGTANSLEQGSSLLPNEFYNIVQQEDTRGNLVPYTDQPEWVQSNSRHIASYGSPQFSALTLYNGNNNISFGGQHIFQPKSNPALNTHRHPTRGFQKNRLHWTPIFSRKQFIQPPKMVIMHPLRTRKLVTTSRHPVTSVCSSYSNALNLSEYFDTSCIEIPMIKERTSFECRKNRRKQKLCSIPGSENFLFEVQRNDNDELAFVPSVIDYELSSEVDPYPETELPELDEIFRRKKKTASTPASSNKKVCSISHALGSLAPTKKIFQITSTLQHTPTLQESSASFEEKISVSTIAIRKGRSNLSIDKNDLIFSSESDSGDSEHEKDEHIAQNNKSLKCQKCNKLFKTTRSLAIHTKRCTAVRRNSIYTYSEIYEEDTFNIKNKPNIHKGHIDSQLNKIQEDLSLENNPNIYASHEEECSDKQITHCATSVERKPRPITRSQTKRSVDRSYQLLPVNVKRSKCN